MKKSESEYDLILLTNCDTKLQQERVLNKCSEAEPRHGELWAATSKRVEK